MCVVEPKSAIYVIIATFLDLVISYHAIDEGTTVYPEVFIARDSNGPQTLLIQKDFSFSLYKASVLAPIVTIQRVTQEGIFHSHVNGVHIERHLYYNAEHRASLLVEPVDDGGYRIQGIVNATHRIAPAEPPERHSTGVTSHKLYRIGESRGSCDLISTQEPKDYQAQEERILEARTAGQNYTLELHVITDAAYNARFTSDLERTSYITIFFHSVSLRLQQLNPPISICIKSIETSGDSASIVKLWNGAKLLGTATLHSLRDYVSKNPTANASDFVHLLTGRDMIRPIRRGMSSNMIGTSYVGKVCESRKVGTSEDTPPLFSGVSTAAHIMGHTLGADHDGHGSSWNCAARNGYIMSPYFGAKQDFSECSRKAISYHILQKQASCLTTSTYTRTLVFPDPSIKLPGNVIDGQTYCRSYYPQHKNITYIRETKDLQDCKLRCYREGHPKWPTTKDTVLITAQDGTKCNASDPAKECKAGSCV